MRSEIIIVTGCVGTGKTKTAREIAEKKKANYVDVNKLIEKYKLSVGYDKERNCKIISIRKLNSVLIKRIKDARSNNKSLVIDSHLSHYLPKKYVDLCVVTKCNPIKLASRLKERSYSKEKIQENIDAELFDVCYNEAKERGHKIKIIIT